MPTYIQNSFLYGERRLNSLGSEDYNTSVDTLRNFYVLKNGSIKRRAGTRLENVFDVQDSNVKQILALQDIYILLYEDNSLKALNGNTLFDLQVSSFSEIRYNLETNTRTDTISYDFNNILPAGNIKVKDIRQAVGQVWLLSEGSLPYVCEVIDNILRIRPYFFNSDKYDKYEDIVRAFPIDPEELKFDDFIVGDPSVKTNLVIDHQASLNNNRCRAWLALDTSEETQVNLRARISKMDLSEHIGKPLFFNVLPDDPIQIKPEVERISVQSTTPNDKTTTLTLMHERNYSGDDAYSSGILKNLQDRSDIKNFPSITLYDGNNTPIGSKVGVINELLYGRKYMVIPLRTVKDNKVLIDSDGTIDYFEGYPKAEVVKEAVKETTLSPEDIVITTSAQPVIGGGQLRIIPENVDPEYNTGGSQVDLNSGEITLKQLPLFVYETDASGSFWDLEWSGDPDSIRSVSSRDTLYTHESSVSDDFFKVGETIIDDPSRDALVELGLSRSTRRPHRIVVKIDTRLPLFKELRDNNSESQIINLITTTIDGVSLNSSYIDRVRSSDSFLTIYYDLPLYLFDSSASPDRRDEQLTFWEIYRIGDDFSNVDGDQEEVARQIRTAISSGASVKPVDVSVSLRGHSFSYESVESGEPQFGAIERPFGAPISDGGEENFGNFIQAGQMQLKYEDPSGDEQNRPYDTFAADESQKTESDETNNIETLNEITGVVFSKDFDELFLLSQNDIETTNQFTAFEEKVSYAMVEVIPADSRGSSTEVRFSTGPSIRTLEITDEQGNVVDRKQMIRFSQIGGNDDLTKEMFMPDNRGRLPSVLITFFNSDDNEVKIDVRDIEARVVHARGFNEISNGTFADGTGETSENMLQVAGSLEDDDLNLVRAIGWSRNDDGKFVWFLHARNNSNVITKKDSIKLVINDTNEIELTKQDPIVRGAVSYRSPTPLDDQPTLLDEDVEIKIELETGVFYDFLLAITLAREAKFYAECAIFEIGMPSPAKTADGIRTIGGNNYDLKENKVRHVFSSIDLNFNDVANIQKNIILSNKNKVAFVYDESKANLPVRVLSGVDTEENRRVLALSNYRPGVFSGSADLETIYEYLNHNVDTSPLLKSKQSDTITEYLKRVDFSSIAPYVTEISDIKGQDVNILNITPSFDSGEVYVATDRGMYSVPFNNPRQTVTLRSDQKTQLKPIPFNNKLTYLNSNNLFTTEVLSRERLGFLTTFSGAAQTHMLQGIKGFLYNPILNLYLLNREDGKVVCATDFDRNVEGYGLWDFSPTDLGEDRLKVLHLISKQDDILALCEYRQYNPQLGSFINRLGILKFDFNIAEDLAQVETELDDPVSFESYMRTQNYIDGAIGARALLNTVQIYRMYVNGDNLENLQIGISSLAGNRVFDYVNFNEKTETNVIKPLVFDVNPAYNTKVYLSQTDTNPRTVIHGLVVGGKLGNRS